MRQKLTLSLCLLTGAIYASGFVPNAIANPLRSIIAQQESPDPTTLPQPEVSPQPTTLPEPQLTPKPTTSPEPGLSPRPRPTTSSGATLTLQDLPSDFQEVPPQMTANFVELLRKQLGPVNVDPQNLFAFMTKPDTSPTSQTSQTSQTPQTSQTSQTSLPASTTQNTQVVVGYTGNFPDKATQDKFDAALKDLQQPEIQKQMIEQIRERLKTSAGIEIQDYSAIPELNNLTESSTGMSIKILLAGQSMRVDIGSFRRNSSGALTAVMYPDGQQPKISLAEVVRKLDSRMSSTSPSR